VIVQTSQSASSNHGTQRWETSATSSQRDANGGCKSIYGSLARDFPVKNYPSVMRKGFRTKGGTIMYGIIVTAFCFSIVFVGLLLIVGRLDYFTGYELIYRIPPG
jgi:hypothetical protein